MNGFDQQKAARVWQRVQQAQPQGKQPGHLEELPELMMNEWEAAAAYRQLARQFQGKEGETYQSLARREQKHAACLRGMHSLITGEKYPLQKLQSVKEPPERILRRCYGIHLRARKAYESHAEDPEYGPVFAELARQERELCVTVLELLGKPERL